MRGYVLTTPFHVAKITSHHDNTKSIVTIQTGETGGRVMGIVDRQVPWSIHSLLKCLCHHFDVHVFMYHNQALTPGQGMQYT